MRLGEVGPEGQELLSSLKVALASRGVLARSVEERYLRGAGIDSAKGEGAAPAPSELDVRDLGLRHHAAEEVAEGALHALAAVRLALRGRL
jgi:hypothetical protein